jgi:DNA-binding response OmpR family regulator
MSPQALLCSSDSQVVSALQRILTSSGIVLEICTQADVGMARLHQEKFDAVFIDCDDLPLGGELLKALRTTPSNKQAIAFALLNGGTDVQKAYKLGANFTLEKPLTVDLTTRTLRAATGLIARERRRYFRQEVCAHVQMWIKHEGSETESSALMTNLSETGMLLSQVELRPNLKVRFEFTLPWTEILVRGAGVVTWASAEFAGVRIAVPRAMKRTLEDWVNDRAFRDKLYSTEISEMSGSGNPLARHSTARGRRARA